MTIDVSPLGRCWRCPACGARVSILGKRYQDKKGHWRRNALAESNRLRKLVNIHLRTCLRVQENRQ